MKHTNSNHDEPNQSLFLVPKALLDSLVVSQNKILELLENKPEKETVGDFITEQDAQKFLGRKATWFWGMRTSGRLPFSKVGNKIFYSKKDIQSLLENSRSKSE